MLTCKTCIYNQMAVGPNKEMQRICTRMPPVMHLIPTPQGVAANVTYIPINNEMVACGEFYDGTEIDEG